MSEEKQKKEDWGANILKCVCVYLYMVKISQRRTVQKNAHGMIKFAQGK